ncbi:YjbF family lipoprotein [Salmonella enterica subsp. enterica]|nr:YjbF family lipoprotein [Salmonella enterica subsp. enterica]
MRLNGGHSTVCGARFLETGSRSKVTRKDGATIVTQHGRLVKNAAQRRQLIDVNNLAADPLAKRGQRIIDGATDSHHGLDRTSPECVTPPPFRFLHGEDPIALASAVKDAMRVLDERSDDRSEARWRNRYWIDSEAKFARRNVSGRGSTFR